MTTFFDAFWPNLAATVIGLALGVPIALYLNRIFTTHERGLDELVARQRLHNAIDVLIGACNYNVRVLDEIKDLALNGRVMRGPDLRLTTWDAVGGLLSQWSTPEILQILSHHWLRLRRLEALSTEVFAREISRSLPALDDVELVKSYWQELHDGAMNLSAHAKQAAQMLDQLKSRYPLTKVGRPPETSKDP